MIFVPSEDSDQPGYLFSVHSRPWIYSIMYTIFQEYVSLMLTLRKLQTPK